VNILLPLTVAGRQGVGHRNLRELLAWVSLTAQAGQLPPELSGGERQRAALARAVITSPEVILADEPTGNLDSATGADVIDLLAGLASSHDATVIVATHDTELAARAPRRLAMRDGWLVGNPSDSTPVLSSV
jgi:ABC-type lipoprotein export system ATPase subunit